MQNPLLSNLDWTALLWSAVLAALTGWSNARVVAADDPDKKVKFADVLADTIIGTTAGVALSLVIPEQYPRLHTPGAVTALACLGGMGGRRVYDLALLVMETLAKLKVGIKDSPKESGGDKHDQ